LHYTKRLLRLFAGQRATPIEPDAAPSGTRRLVVAGLFGTRCGLQRGAILMVKEFQARGFEVHAVDLSPDLRKPIDSSFPEATVPARLGQLPVTDVIVHLNPTDFIDGLRAMRRFIGVRSNVIAYWVWELPVLPKSWLRSARFCDAIWVPSPFVADTISRQMPEFAETVRIVPHPVDRDPIPTCTAESRRVVRDGLDYAETDFVLGYSFAFHSNYARKNPASVVTAFRLAFPETDSSAKLLIRMHDADKHPKLRAHLLACADGDPRVRFIDLSSERLPIVDFYHAIDLYFALFRSEGYGLQLVEAAQAGLPVVATGWGLAPDILARPGIQALSYRLVPVDDPQGFFASGPGAVWAEPDVAEAARYARDIRERTLASRQAGNGSRE